MSTQEAPIVRFLRELMGRKSRLPSQLARDLGLSHATISRWLSGKDVPDLRSCQRLAVYSGVPLEKILSIAGHIPLIPERKPADLPQFRDYAHLMYPDELDEDMISVFEDLIERRRQRIKAGGKGE